ncbi:MAG TPA: mucoidy inhibitor MuiA family protein [Hyphomicrobiales bacterium]|jgi:uncharacterized protein (TIGR02231 family)
MRKCLLLLAVCLSAAKPAAADEVPAPSKIDAVTVFPSGAEITRIINVKLAAGDHTLLIGDITGEAWPASIRVEATASGRLEIGSVDARLISLSSSDPAVAQSPRAKIEAQMEALNDSRAAEDAVIQAAGLQQAYLDNLTHLPQTSPASAGSSGREDWEALFGVIGTNMSESLKAVAAARLKQRAIDRQLVELQRQLAVAGSSNGQERTEVRIYVRAAEPLEATVSLRYQTPSASWTPFYDARLTTGDKGGAPSLTLTRQASVLQTTGEDWDGVSLALSTTRPGATTAAPDLNTLAVDFAAGARLQPGAPMANRESANEPQQQVQKLQNYELEENQAAPKKSRPATKTLAPARITSFQAVYNIPGRTVIRSTGEAKRIQTVSETIEPTLTVQTAPRIDHTAYLYAHLVLPANASPLLGGQAALFRDNVFVGNGQLPQLAPGEAHDLGFGADERVKVKRVVLDDKRGETGTFTSSYVEERRYAIAVRNLHDRAIEVQVLDRIPIPMHQDIKVDFQMNQGPQPSESDVNDQRGVMMWRISAAAGEEKQIGFGYRLTAPSGKPILYGEFGEERERLEQFKRAAPAIR